MKLAKNVVVPFRPSERRKKEELAFLPAALEIVETPASPIGRAIAILIATLFCVALGWAYFGKIDIIASAPGKIIPSGRTKVIQPFETGVIRAIRVRDGQNVKAGDILIELDPTINAAEREHIQSDLTAAQLDIARLRAALSEGTDPLADFHPPETASPSLVATHRQFLLSQIGEYRAKLAGLDRQRAQKEAESATVAATVSKLEAVVPVVQQKVDVRGALYNREFSSKLQYLENLQQLIETQKELAVQQSRQRETEAAIAALKEARVQAAAEFSRTIHDDLAKAEAKAGGLTQDLIRAEQKTKLQELTAPEDGVVQQLAVHTVGGVVTPAQTLLVVVPVGTHLEVEAMVSNRDIGFVHPGEEAEIKVETFNFTRYGLLHGRVMHVSQDAITREKSQDKSGGKPQGSDSNTDPKPDELVYAARVSLDRTQMEVENKLVNLSPGMAVTVEIKTGSRTVLNYLLSPLLRYKQESLRER
ncbi:MAG: HlyD family type I secretion periplasmic adaptor subunit [Alphaproteobacteria bacterium]|nr:MAG: HlyD family type I secretion periplasmic adaptor subunit [Alphaproteobacteria bacterium]